MANGPFINAAAKIEEAIAAILQFAATTEDKGFIERITRLAIKKEIVLELLLDEVGQVETECRCSGAVNVTIPNTSITVNNVQDIGTVMFVGQICPNCFVEGSGFTFNFMDNTPNPDNSFTFVSTSISPSTCSISPTSISLSFNGLGVVTRADMSTVNVFFSGSLTEGTVPPGATDNFFMFFNSQEVGNPFSASYSSPSLPDSSITVEECNS
ncbi:hypothetical protein [Metabacillus iocasae]|uniref:Uncharacterized protein n=1 Tax=Priestia iocasae TaxID=2291674 RepID=A0ABS2QXY4_9BACI|nr:hypothetical protein [Metabacillus iocasae]MBM7704349.1 hypothetical protein [Metabacillus iocasae]